MLKQSELDVIGWSSNGTVRLLDQTLIPGETRYLEIDSVEGMVEAIKALRVRGAPLIGIAAAMGVAAAAKKRESERGGKSGMASDLDWLERAVKELAAARPTAVNLRWALERLQTVASERLSEGDGIGEQLSLDEILRSEAQRLWDEDAAMCDAIGDTGAGSIPEGATVLTHCNTGKLATGGIGTALGAIYRAHDQGKGIKVVSCEARPLGQGSRLTAWELHQAGVPCTVIVDNASASLMDRGEIDLVIVGADRIAANGDVANKVGTYGLAVLAKEHRVPFYVAAPRSTFDLAITTGSQIPIEERPAEEIATAAGVSVFNPAFDVTPARLITGIFTDAGLIQPPLAQNISLIFGEGAES